MEITAAMVKELREATGAGIMDCKVALTDSNGDMARAKELLREKGMKTFEKKQSRSASEGVVGSYIHAGGKIGVLVEVNCETDFVARTEAFQTFVKEVAMQVAATNPSYISREDVPEDVLETERRILRVQAQEERKPENVIEKIIEGRLRKFYEANCLLEQAYIRDEDKNIEALLKELVAKVGENIVIRRFARFHVGQSGS
ncbi:translation elongation factor Ts [Candidatus Poribacteria bacterium]|nr:translation elongation factor Ts [Candidatus Poribacteria bacterium]